MDRSWAWATARGLIRHNPVHGEEEARLVLSDYFQHGHEIGHKNEIRGTGDVEDPWVILLVIEMRKLLEPLPGGLLSGAGPRWCLARHGGFGGCSWCWPRK